MRQSRCKHAHAVAHQIHRKLRCIDIFENGLFPKVNLTADLISRHQVLWPLIDKVPP
jgi:hypothetical protein